MVDTSFYPKPNTAQSNPLAMMQQMLGIQQGVNQNRLFQQEFADKAAINNLFTNTPLDQSTGFIDTNALMKNAQQQGVGRLMPQLMEQAQKMRREQLGITDAELGIVNKRIDMTQKLLSPLATKADLTPQDVARVMLQLQEQGVMQPKDTAAFLMNMPAGSNPKELQTWITNTALIPSLDAQRRIEFQFGRPTTIDTGPSIQGATQMPSGELKPAGAPIMKGLDPATATAPTSAMIRNPDGTLTPSNVTRAQFAQMAKQGGVATAPPMSPEGLTPEQLLAPKTWFDEKTNKQVTGTMQQFLQQVGQKYKLSDATPTAAGTSTAGGPVAASPTLGAEAAANVAGQESAKAQQAMFNRAANAPQRLFQLGEMQRLAGDVKTGPGTDTLNNFKAYLVNLPGMEKFVDDIKVAKYQELAKYVQQNANTNFGSGTDAQLAATISGNPNIKMVNLAFKDLVTSAMGIERMDMAKSALARAENVKPEDFSKWSTDWGNSVDARAFILDMLPKPQQDKLREELKKAPKQAQEKFRRSYNLAQGMFGSGQQ